MLFRSVFFSIFSSRRRHTGYWRDWSSDVCSSDLSKLRNVLCRYLVVIQDSRCIIPLSGRIQASWCHVLLSGRNPGFTILYFLSGQNLGFRRNQVVIWSHPGFPLTVGPTNIRSNPGFIVIGRVNCYLVEIQASQCPLRLSGRNPGFVVFGGIKILSNRN